MATILPVPEVAHWMGLLPLAWLAILRSRDTAHWWIGSAFGISWLADSLSHWVAPWLVSAAYPVSQAGIVGAVFLARKEASIFAGIVIAAAIASVAWQGNHSTGLLPRTVAWGGIAGVVVDRRALGTIRVALLVTFGGGLVCWYVYAGWPSWPSWSAYQGMRLAGILLFCRAVWSPHPSLRLEPL